MSAHSFLAAMNAEMERLAESQEARDAAFLRAIKVIADAYAGDIKRQLSRKTTRREAWLRENYASWPGNKRDILIAVNDLPGAPLTIIDLSNWAYDMKLKRSTARLSQTNRRTMLRGKDNDFSMAAAEEVDTIHLSEECPITLGDALEWGRRNGMDPSGSLAEDLRSTNQIRTLLLLPPFAIIADKPMQEPLPRLIRHEVSDGRRH